MKKLINLYKPIGLTTKQLIDKFRKNNSQYRNVKIGFAGRLDPLAHGVILLMIEDETKNRDQYLGLDKEYEFEVLFGVSTDTYDALGIINHQTIQPSNNTSLSKSEFEKKINEFIKSKLGKQIQPYPPYSSIEVAGKPLFQWARENKLSEIEIPSKEIEIYKFELLEIKNSHPENIKERIFENIGKVNGDFRQKKIMKSWEKFFSGSKNKSMNQTSKFPIAKFSVRCSSGTYVRSLTNNLGESLGNGATTLSILRTRVGNYSLTDSLFL